MNACPIKQPFVYVRTYVGYISVRELLCLAQSIDFILQDAILVAVIKCPNLFSTLADTRALMKNEQLYS